MRSVDLSNAFTPEAPDYTPAPASQTTIPKSGSIERGKLFKRLPDNMTQLEGYKFAVGIFVFQYSEKKKNGEVIETNISLQGAYIQGTIDRLESMGFRKRKPDGMKGRENAEESFFIREAGAVIEPVTIGHMLEEFRALYVKSQKALKVTYKDTERTFPAEALTEAFNKNSNNIFHAAQLRALPLHSVPVLKDTKKAAFFAFRNAVCKVTPTSISTVSFESLQGKKCVWASAIIPHDYTPAKAAGHWARFVENISSAATDPDRYAATLSAIGYLLHDYQTTALSKAVILYDEAPTSKDKPEGGTGKGVFLQGIHQLRSGVIIDGKGIKEDDRFKWQQIGIDTQFVQIDDPKPDFKFEMLFSLLTSGWSIERKNLPTFTIKPEDTPKICICTNTALTNNSTSHRRRQFIIELSDHYSRKLITGKEQPIVAEHGRVFFSANEADKWTSDDWNSFFAFQFEAVQYYLKEGLQGYEPKNVKRNQLIQSTSDDFAAWAPATIQAGSEYPRNKLLEDFKGTSGDDTFTMRKFSQWVKLYAELYGLKYTQRESGREYFIRLKSGGIEGG